jgi:hypothetical protein
LDKEMEYFENEDSVNDPLSDNHKLDDSPSNRLQTDPDAYADEHGDIVNDLSTKMKFSKSKLQ